jgi:hypothetical protein
MFVSTTVQARKFISAPFSETRCHCLAARTKHIDGKPLR